MTNDVKSRLLDSLARDRTGRLALKLAEQLIQEGMGQVEMYRLYVSVRSDHFEDYADDDVYDALTDILDYIHGGPWAKGGDLFDTELDEKQLKENG